MRKLLYALVAAGLAAACADSSVNEPLPSSANFAVSDGANGGNPHFYFLPPLVPAPNPTGVFNPELSPVVEVHLLADPADVRCAPTANPVASLTGVEVFPGREFYGVGWPTSQYGLANGDLFRLCVKVFDMELGYRDVRPVETAEDLPPDPASNPVYDFVNGTWVSTRFRIEEGALCQRGVVDCTETFIGPAGGQAICDNSLCGLQIEPNAVNQNFLFIVELVDCPVDNNGNVQFINADIPQYPGCLDITVEPQSQFNALAIPALAAACYDAPNLSHDQQDRLQLHHQKDDGTIEALPNAQTGLVDCSNYQAIATDAHPLAIYASNVWRKVKRAVLPNALDATDRGFGGRGFTQESPFVWALPSQMEQVGWTNPEAGQPGEEKTAAVLVTDEAGDPVENATVTFDVTNGSGPPTAPVAVLTDAAGMASVDWTLGPAGANRLEASGRGIGLAAGEPGTHLDNVPPGGDGVFADHIVNVVDLGTGVLHFDATVCGGGADTDGSIGVGEYANSQSFAANTKKGTVPATLYWSNDCDNLYLGLELPIDDSDANDVVFRFDNDNDGAAAPGDGILSIRTHGRYLHLDPRNRKGGFGFVDQYLNHLCQGQGCVRNDPPAFQDGSGVFGYDGPAGVATYEIVHPLASGDIEHDFQLGLGDAVGVFLELQIGNGNNGRTRYPGQGYMTININP